MLISLKFEDRKLHVLDQKQLPHTEAWFTCEHHEDVAKAIESMAVRGAPAIANAAVWGLVIYLQSFAAGSKNSLTLQDFEAEFQSVITRLEATRPTAVNLFGAMRDARFLLSSFPKSIRVTEVYERFLAFAQAFLDADLSTCKAIGDLGAEYLKSISKKSGIRPLKILTHCNTGSLATAGYGTALGMIRSLARDGLIETVFVDETRPYLQGSRLTAYELRYEKIPYQLICDNMAASAMSTFGIDAVVVGADRIAKNGDTANKIGTYGLAILAKHHGVPFVVAAPMTTVDPKTPDGRGIHVEQRPGDELRHIAGISIAPKDAPVWNPSFDVTPSSLITAIVTEAGVIEGNYDFN